MIPPEGVVLIFALVAGGLVTAILATAYILRVKGGYGVSRTVYECGEEPFGDARIQFNFRYYVFALIYVIFAVEIVFIVPWAVSLRHFDRSSVGLVFSEMVLFLGILAFGLSYAWKKGALEWL